MHRQARSASAGNRRNTSGVFLGVESPRGSLVGARKRGKSPAMRKAGQVEVLHPTSSIPAAQPILFPIPHPHAADLIYDLRDPHGASDACYAAVEAFSARVLDEAEHCAAGLLDGYTQFLRTAAGERPRSRGEYAIELLTLGMSLNLYGHGARRTPRPVVALARLLLRIRRRSPRLKPAADLARAALFRPFLPQAARSSPPDANQSLLPRLITWLRAAGEFDQEAVRLAHWLAYLRTHSRSAADECLRVAINLFAWFERASADALGRYTPGVQRFLAGEYARRGVREDQLFCGRSPVEYHLAMVSAEIMNAGLRADFEKTARKAVLLPTCMRGKPAAACKARVDGVDMTCTGCDPECAVNRITRRMARRGVPVYLVPHASSFSKWLERWQREHDVGVVAVACLMNILAGGYEMRARGIASQCVVLDYPGCEGHWRVVGIATGVNEEKLVQIACAGG